MDNLGSKIGANTVHDPNKIDATQNEASASKNISKLKPGPSSPPRAEAGRKINGNKAYRKSDIGKLKLTPVPSLKKTSNSAQSKIRSFKVQPEPSFPKKAKNPNEVNRLSPDIPSIDDAGNEDNSSGRQNRNAPRLSKQLSQRSIKTRLGSFDLEDERISRKNNKVTKTKDSAQGVAYMVKTAERGTNTTVDSMTMHAQRHGFLKDADKDIDPSQVSNPNAIVRNSDNIADFGAGSGAVPSLVEYAMAVWHFHRDENAVGSSKKEIRNFNRTLDAFREADDRDEQSKLGHKIRLKAGKARLAEIHLKSSDSFMGAVRRRLGGIKAWLGGAKYTTETAIFVNNVVRGATSAGSFGQGYAAAVDASATASSAAGLVSGVIFDPVSAVYYGVKAGYDVADFKKYGKQNALAKEVKGGVDDPELKAVVKRIENKTAANRKEKIFAFLADASRAIISAVGAVGAGAAIAAALGATGAAGVAAVLTAWPVVLGLAAAAAALTVGYVCMKAHRNSQSKSEKEMLNDAMNKANETIDQLDSSNKDIDLDTKVSEVLENAPVYNDNTRKMLEDADNLELFPTNLFDDEVDAATFKQDLLDRYNNNELLVSDLEVIAIWSQNMLAARDTGMAVSMLMVKLTEEAVTATSFDEFKNSQSETMLALKKLGVSERSLKAAFAAIVEVDKQSSKVLPEERQAAFMTAQKVLAKEWHLR